MNPPFVEDLYDEKKKVSRGWINWFQITAGAYNGKPSSNITQPAVGASPFTYHNTTPYRQQTVLTVNALSALTISRDNSTFFTLSTTLGTPVTLCPGDYLKITYAGAAPTLTVIPS